MQYRHNLRENLWLALDTLRTHKFRSFLTVLGVLIGTTTVIGVASVVAGLDRQVVEMAQDFGVRTLFIYKFQPGPRFRLTREERMRKPLTYEDMVAIQELCPSVEAVAALIFRGIFSSAEVKYKGQEMVNAFFAGSTPDDFRIINANLVDGRIFTEIDNRHRRDVAVIGADVVTRFFEHEDPIGKSILVDGHSFEVIGTLAKRKAVLGDSGEDRMVLIPYFTFKKIYPEAKENYIHALAYPGRIAEAVDEVTGVLRRRRHDKPSDPDSFGVTTAESAINQFREITGTVALVMVVLSSIGLLVGGIGVMNIMLVSVTERTREIGVRKAIGARRRDITWQFLLEAMTLTGAGGVLGILAGFVLSFSVRTIFPDLPSTVPLWAVFAGFLVSVSIGLFFGMWPALKAARLDPIVALRYE
jgi:ABC-type antimicrobial peptide transport system permease subunit